MGGMCWLVVVWVGVRFLNISTNNLFLPINNSSGRVRRMDRGMG